MVAAEPDAEIVKIFMRFQSGGDRFCIEPFAGLRDITVLGHFDFQFYDKAAEHYFRPGGVVGLSPATCVPQPTYSGTTVDVAS